MKERTTLWTLVALVWGAAAVFVGYVYAQDALETLPDQPAVQNPSLTFKMERNSNDPRGQEFVALRVILGVHAQSNGDGTTTYKPADGTFYQRCADISSVGFDHRAETAALETSVVWLRDGRHYIVAGSVTDVWGRIAEAGLYKVKPAKGVKE